jgi:methyl-accepting chemotaxis protein
MKKLSLRSLVNLTLVLLVFLPVAVTSVMLLTNGADLSPVLKGLLILTLGTIIIAMVVQNLLLSGFLKGIKNIIDRLELAEKGDLTVTLEEESVQELNELSQTTGKIIKEFNDMISSVSLSTSDVRHLINTVVETSHESAKSAEEISKSTEAVTEGAVKQAEDSELCYNMSTELVEKVEEVSKSTELMSSKAEQVKSMTGYGKESIADLLDKSKLSETNIMEINRSMEELGSMALDITNITDIITSIATQTNLLSLNASIEAARAGDAGKGFAVVAGEIKKLAEKSLESVQSIVRTISTVQDQVKGTTEKINATTQTIMYQIEAVHKTNEAFNGIDEAAEEMFSKLNTVREGINQLDKYKTNLASSIESISAVAAETAASSEEITSLMYSQNNSAEVLVELSSDLENLVAGLDSKLQKYNFDKVKRARKSFAVVTVLDIPFFDDTFKGAEEIGRKLGADIVRVAPKSWSPNVQAEALAEIVEKGVDGIALGPIDSPEVREVVKKAQAKGIKLVTFDNELANSGIPGFIGTDNFAAGKSIGEATVKCMNGKGKILITAATDSNDNMKARIDGFKRAIAQYPNMKVVAIQANSEFIDERVEEIKSLLNKHTEIDCLVYIDYQGAETMVKLLPQVTKDIKVVGFDKTDEAMKLIRSGKINSIVVQRPRLWGEIAVKRLNDLALGKSIPKFDDSGTFEINKKNISMYK